MNVDESVPVDQIPDISTSSVWIFEAKRRRISRETSSAVRSKERELYSQALWNTPKNHRMPTHVRHLSSNASYKMTLKFGIVLLQKKFPNS